MVAASLRTARATVTKKLAGAELPSCWAAATVSAAVNATDRSTVSAKASRRRLMAKVERISSQFGARTAVTLDDGFRVVLMGRIGIGDAIRNAELQRSKVLP